MSDTTAVWWVRRDLRLSDNAALSHLLDTHTRVVPLYIAPARAAPAPGAASAWWLHHALEALGGALRARGGALVIRRGEPLAVLRQVIDECGARALAWNRGYEPDEVTLGRRVKAGLRDDGIDVSSFSNGLVCEPGTLLTASGTPYRVFTAYWRARQREARAGAPLTAPKRMRAPALHGLEPAALGLLPSVRWDQGLEARWQPGEASGRAAVRSFAAGPVGAYAGQRDVPAAPGTSALSAHLHYGEISARELEHTLAHVAGAEPFCRQLAWREFAASLLFHFPHTVREPLDARFARFPWRRRYAGALRRWQRGETGIPLVDAGMRQLWHCGWMHNRVRMVAASFLTKNLRIPWTEGADWFMDTLVDADLANNTLGWQWVAGCGADAAPYFRVFNPVRQGQRFDADGRFVRHWLPPLRHLPDGLVHEPWRASAGQLAAAGLRLGRDYPRPMVDLSDSRREALAAYTSLRA